MKKLLALAMTGILVFVSADKSDAQNGLPSGRNTSNSWYTMTAKINGKDCKALKCMPVSHATCVSGYST